MIFHAAITATNSIDKSRPIQITYDCSFSAARHDSFSGQPSHWRETRACYQCDELGNLAHHSPHCAPPIQSLGSQLAYPAPASTTKDISQGMKGGTRVG